MGVADGATEVPGYAHATEALYAPLIPDRASAGEVVESRAMPVRRAVTDATARLP